ncbi:MAG: hypothetical protein NC432_04105 [Roseburia sp.]|nr:hypothetical protein [Roseburia sp.]MCM1097196.1 hypothetical protein [Ruminococcus flavefaciens]
MHNFQEEYRQAVDQELPEFQMDAGIVRDELHHHKMQVRRRRSIAVKGCTAAVVFLLLGAGTAAAKSYVGAALEMRKNGYVVSGADGEDGFLTADAGAAETAWPEERAGAGDAKNVETGEGSGARSAAENAGTGEKAKAGGTAEGVWPAEGTITGEDGGAALDDVVEIPIEETEYESLTAFLQNAPAALEIPDLSLLAEEWENGKVLVAEDDMTIFLHVTENGRSFCLRQTDYRNVEGFSAATAYGGENANERNVISGQGFCYTVFDTVDEEGHIEATHAVILLEGRELSLDFCGWEAEFIERILKELNLELYFR